MRQLITQEQIKELEELAVDHQPALVAFGADAYRDGYKRGVLHGAVAFGVGVAIAGAVNIYKSVRRDEKHKQSNDGEA